MAGSDPAIHVFPVFSREVKAWITGTSPVMTMECMVRMTSRSP